jgi:hypothetical protein
MKGRINAEDCHVIVFKAVVLSNFQNIKNEDTVAKNKSGRSCISASGVVMAVK